MFFTDLPSAKGRKGVELTLLLHLFWWLQSTGAPGLKAHIEQESNFYRSVSELPMSGILEQAGINHRVKGLH